MTKSEGLNVIQEAIYLLPNDYVASKEECEKVLEFLMSKGFPIPCNKKGKFDWDKEVQEVKNESI